MSIDQTQELKNIILNFRVSELSQLLSFCYQSRFGKKAVLQERALQLLKKGNLTLKIQSKIRELDLRRCQNYKEAVDTSSVQDASSNECVYSDSEMAHLLTNNIQIPEYFSMPKTFDVAIKNMKNYSSISNVKFKPIPFDDVLNVICEPTILPQNNKVRLQDYTLIFKFNHEQANLLSMSREYVNSKFEYNTQVQLRFCSNNSSLVQDDLLPFNICIKLNSKTINLPNIIPLNKPGAELKRQSKPIDLTQYCKISPIVNNSLHISWTLDPHPSNPNSYCFGIFLVEKLTSKNLLDRLIAKGVSDLLYTQKLIISKLTEDDCEISTTSLIGNLNCPLGKMRLRIPARSLECSHIQCFDAELYLQMNEKKPSWICPVCDKKADYSTLFIDGLFTKILKETSPDTNEIEFTEDGNWKSVNTALNKVSQTAPQRRKLDEEPLVSKKSKPEYEVILLESSDEEESSLVKSENCENNNLFDFQAKDICSNSILPTFFQQKTQNNTSLQAWNFNASGPNENFTKNQSLITRESSNTTIQTSNMYNPSGSGKKLASSIILRNKNNEPEVIALE